MESSCRIRVRSHGDLVVELEAEAFDLRRGKTQNAESRTQERWFHDGRIGRGKKCRIGRGIVDAGKLVLREHRSASAKSEAQFPDRPVDHVPLAVSVDGDGAVSPGRLIADRGARWQECRLLVRASA